MALTGAPRLELVRGPFLARLGPPLPFAGILTALVVIALALIAWNALRRRKARWASVVLLVGAFLIIGCFVPSPEWESHGRVTGRFGGHVEIPVRADATAPLVVTGGSGSVNAPHVLIMDCATRCDFALGASPHAGQFASARVDQTATSLTVVVDGGPLQLQDRDLACYAAPLTLRLLGTTSCIECSVREYVVGHNVTGARNVTPTLSPASAC